MTKYLRVKNWEIVAVDREALSGRHHIIDYREFSFRKRAVTDAPETPGVYAFVIAGRVHYVGSSLNLASRLRTHLLHSPLLHAATVKIKRSRRFGDWLMWEARLIRRLRPAGNARGRGR